MIKRRLRHIVILISVMAGVILIKPIDSTATHLRAGQITVSRPNCQGLTFNITITAYTNTGSSIKFGEGFLDFGDGSTPYITPTIDNTDLPALGLNVGVVVFTYTYTYAGPGRYTISYFEHNRNAGILNMSNSVETPFYIETVIDIDPAIGCDNSPVLTVPPIDKACTGTKWLHNPGAYDPDGDSLSYVLVEPKQDRLHAVNNYSDPNSKPFYVGLDYNAANETKTGTPTFAIDPITGTITWDAPGEQGEYNIAFHVIEWRKYRGTWVQLGYVTRDMQIIVEDCSNHRPLLKVPADTCIVAGAILNKIITAHDPDLDSVKIEAFSQIFTINPSPATVQPTPAIFQKSTNTQDPALTFRWQTECDHVKEQPYQVVFKATDSPAKNLGGVSLVDFKTWNIKVVGPAPKWVSVAAVANHSAQLTWEAYACASKAISMQIWRRVESNPYDPPSCVTGMPPFLGFTMIDVVPIATTTYLDNNGKRGLAAGAQYCYRLVAVFPQPTGGLSYVSKEDCFTSLLDAPIITNVTVDKTGTTGEDTIKWIAPLKSDIDVALYPPPYTYQLFRASDFSGNTGLTPVHPGKLDTTFFIDEVNTSSVFNYRVLAFSGSTPIDTSASASMVQLSLRPRDASIDLTWNALVPWSNVIASRPLHTIYRGPAGSTRVSDLVPIATVNVLQQGFHYTDAGPLDKTQTYCYCVRTEGGYGNPKIPEPLANFSQIACVQPSDNTPPCAVVINSRGTNCSDVFRSSCTPNSFSNVLTWNRPTSTCQEEVFSYNVYAAARTNGIFSIRAMAVTDTFFIDKNLSSFAQCYKVTAVSRSGIESALSDAFCFDNCPYYELPNVFTPGTVDMCNDKFSAFSARVPVEEGSQGLLCPPRTDILAHCARFVNSVNFTVYNRWGKEVYSYQSVGENSIYIDWDGRDDNGRELSSGVYYYAADVNFDVVDPAKQNQVFKGWVQIVR